jgi:hypothetical protein
VILAFMAGAAALLGAAIAWFVACAGGSHRDHMSGPSMTWDGAVRARYDDSLTLVELVLPLRGAWRKLRHAYGGHT